MGGETMEMFMNIVPVLGVIGLLFAGYLAAKVSRQDAGTEKMKEISRAISEGARAFLMSEYRILVIFVIVLFVLIGIGIGNWVTAVCFDRSDKGECPHGERGKNKGNESGAVHRFFRRCGYGNVCSWFWRAGSQPCLSAD